MDDGFRRNNLLVLEASVPPVLPLVDDVSSTHLLLEEVVEEEERSSGQVYEQEVDDGSFHSGKVGTPLEDEAGGHTFCLPLFIAFLLVLACFCLLFVGWKTLLEAESQTNSKLVIIRKY